MANAKPKNYRSGGFSEDFQLTEEQRKVVLNRGAKESDIGFIESEMRRYLNMARESPPTPAQVLASFKAGEDAVHGLMQWLDDADDLTRDYIEDAAHDNNIPLLRFREYRDILKILDVAIEMGRREAPPVSPGRRERLAKIGLAISFLQRWNDRETAKGILLVVLENESSRNLNRFLVQAAERIKAH